MNITIKNFQVIKQADLVFDEGITAIIGQTNSGKSSIIRAIEGAINNRAGTSFINYDSDSTEVTIEEGSNIVTWVKAKKGNSSYNINGTELLKIGKSQLDEVGELFNMAEVRVNDEKFRLNFWKQMSPPFLVNKTGFQLFEFISKSKEQALIVQYQSDKQSEIKQLTEDIKADNTRIDSKNKDEVKYRDTLALLKDVSEFNLDMLSAIYGLCHSLETSLDSYTDYDNASLVNFKEYDTENKLFKSLEPKVISIGNDINKYKELSGELGSLEGYEKDYDNALKDKEIYEKESIKQSKAILALKTNIDKITKLSIIIKNVGGNLAIYETGIESINNINNEIEDLLKLQEGTMKSLSEFTTCPLCGQDITNHIHKEE